MFAQMKSRRRGPSKPCPCGGVCECHKPSKEKLFPLVFPIAFPLVIPGLWPGIFLLMMSLGERPPPHIQVYGQDCIVHHVTDHCTSTGACSGHDEAICPKEIK